jgi:hypothetical protein
MIFEKLGAELIRVNIDDNGMLTDMGGFALKA